MPSPAEIRQRLAQTATDLGFSQFGVTSAKADTISAERLMQWLALGYHASMEWMSRTAQKRCDLQEVLPGARSIISVAMNYYHPQAHSEGCGDLKISRYAWGEDYHNVLGERLRQLKEALDAFVPGHQSLTYVDTGPLMEKAIAERAGIGWIGKNACLITRGQGSWVFLGEIITTAELPADQPHTDFCGSCTLCQEACPTGAFPQPYVLDSNKCISYHTIENRGEVPEALAQKFDGWIFGCDICQDVCPWNSFARPSPEPAFAPREGHIHPPAERWLALTPEEFRTEFAGSPILRAKSAGFARNIVSQRNPIE